MISRFDSEKAPNVRSVLKIVLLVILIGMAVNLIIALFMDRSMIFHAIARVRAIYLVVPFLCYLLNNIIDSFRTIMVSRQFKARVPIQQAFYNSVLGQLFTNLTPMAAGGQPFQIYHLQQHGLSSRTAANIIFSRFVENATTLMLILVASIPVIIRVSGQLGAARAVIFVGLGITFLFALFFLITFIRADLIGKLAMALQKGIIGQLVARLSRRTDWSEKLVYWSGQLRDEVHFLWTEKLWIMLIDTTLGIVNVALQAFSVFYVLRVVVTPDVNFLDVFTSYIVVWQVVFYIPTPGASGSVEGGFAAVYSGLTRNPPQTLVAIVVWRVATYYLHIVFQTIVLMIYLRFETARRLRSAGAPEGG